MLERPRPKPEKFVPMSPSPGVVEMNVDVTTRREEFLGPLLEVGSKVKISDVIAVINLIRAVTGAKRKAKGMAMPDMTKTPKLNAFQKEEFLNLGGIGQIVEFIEIIMEIVNSGEIQDVIEALKSVGEEVGDVVELVTKLLGDQGDGGFEPGPTKA